MKTIARTHAAKIKARKQPSYKAQYLKGSWRVLGNFGFNERTGKTVWGVMFTCSSKAEAQVEVDRSMTNERSAVRSMMEEFA